MISTSAWREKGDTLSIKGHKIFYVDTKDMHKDIILLIHGFPTSSWDWVKIWDALAAEYRLIAMDMLGFGYSDKPDPHKYSINEQADIIEDLIETLALDKFHVLAHDYGDTVAQELLARQNDGSGKGIWQSICFLNGGLFPETHQALFIQKLLLSPLGPLINKLTTRKRFDVSVSKVFGANSQPSIDELDGFWKLINHNNGRHIFHNLISYMSDRIEHRERWVDALRNTKVPLALINGSVDPVSGAHMVRHYQNIVGAPDYLQELASIGHYPQVEDPINVVKYYLEFLKLKAT
ncbi:alpha/beta fold hydrolase [Hellea balneolensis]|uniref:alpha/beta fold hydrolase n=1 Tax=Hellea balneolensis TaxID=287478 RepID=UPI00040EF6BA|nr:alpha/beta hydrolase [Hellea balneolensis]